ncbi:MAG: GatB/YqeY domain-containing protein [Nitrospinaceae bacterium]
MNLKDKLFSDLKGAMKARDTLKVDTLRILSSEIKNREIELRQPLDDTEILALLINQIKKRKEAAALYDKGGRPELKEQEEREMAVLECYLPPQATDEELRRRIREVIEETGAQSLRDMGQVMRVVVPEFKGQADGVRLKALVTEQLNA